MPRDPGDRRLPEYHSVERLPLYTDFDPEERPLTQDQQEGRLLHQLNRSTEHINAEHSAPPQIIRSGSDRRRSRGPRADPDDLRKYLGLPVLPPLDAASQLYRRHSYQSSTERGDEPLQNHQSALHQTRSSRNTSVSPSRQSTTRRLARAAADIGSRAGSTIGSRVIRNQSFGEFRSSLSQMAGPPWLPTISRSSSNSRTGPDQREQTSSLFSGPLSASLLHVVNHLGRRSSQSARATGYLSPDGEPVLQGESRSAINSSHGSRGSSTSRSRRISPPPDLSHATGDQESGLMQDGREVPSAIAQVLGHGSSPPHILVYRDSLDDVTNGQATAEPRGRQERR